MASIGRTAVATVIRTLVLYAGLTVEGSHRQSFLQGSRSWQSSSTFNESELDNGSLACPCLTRLSETFEVLPLFRTSVTGHAAP